MSISRLALLAPLIAFLGLSIYLTIGLTRDPSRIPSVLIDQPVPQFSLPAIDGFDRGLSSTDLVGKVSLVNVFASWCVGCAIEHPGLMEIAANEDIFIAGVNWKDRPGDGAAWLDQNGNPYDAIGDDADGRIAIDFGVTGAPETFIVDHNGRIRYKQVGPITADAWRRNIKPLIESLKADMQKDA